MEWKEKKSQRTKGRRERTIEVRNGRRKNETLDSRQKEWVKEIMNSKINKSGFETKEKMKRFEDEKKEGRKIGRKETNKEKTNGRLDILEEVSMGTEKKREIILK